MAQVMSTTRVVALVTGDAVDEPMIEMACMLARRQNAQLFMVAALVVERSLPLDAPLTEAAAQVRRALERAKSIASCMGSVAETRELRTRDVAAALVDEAADLGCDHIILGFAGEARGPGWTVAEQVLRNAPCSVWLHKLRR